MRLPRIYTEQPLLPGCRVFLEEKPSRHLIRVLRLHPEDGICLFNGSGREFRARIVATDKRSMQLEVQDQSDVEPEPQLSIHLGIGISKGGRMDFAIQKSVELGVAMIAPLVTQRMVVRLSDKRWQKRHAHWSNIVISACEQSGRNRLPAVSFPTPLTAWLPQLVGGVGVLLDRDCSSRLNQITPPRGQVMLLTGPEGGLSEQEKRLAVETGFAAVSLGPRTMRTETAPLAAIAAIQMLWGDF